MYNIGLTLEPVLSRPPAVFLLLAVAAVVATAACESSGGPVTVTGTGVTNQPVQGWLPTPTPEWFTPRPSPPPTPAPPGILPSPTPSGSEPG